MNTSCGITVEAAHNAADGNTGDDWRAGHEGDSSLSAKIRLETALDGFCGTENYHALTLLGRQLLATDGVEFLCREAKCYWLMDAIASHQRAVLRTIAGAFQVWRLRRNNSGSGAVLTCDDGNGFRLKLQRIQFTDFPLDEITIYVERCCVSNDGRQICMVAMLPSER
jgi:hypothetical protein